MKVWESSQAKQLTKVLCDINDATTMQEFLRDVMTESEIIEISARLQAAKMLAKGDKYENITNVTHLSSRTIARISQWLKNGCGGYQAALGLLPAGHHSVTS